MAFAANTPVRIALQPVKFVSGGPVSEAYNSPFVGSTWPDVQSRLAGIKIFSGTIYRLSDYGYSTEFGYSYPTAALEVVEMLKDLSTLNGGSMVPSGIAGGLPVYMESPVLLPGTLPNGAQYNSAIEGFDGSFLGVMGFIRNSLHYAVRTKVLTVAQARDINVNYIAMDEPLYHASIYKSPTNWIENGIRIQSPQWTIEQVAEKAAQAFADAKRALGPYDPGLRFGDIEPLPYVSASQVDAWATAFEKSAIAAGVKPTEAKLAFFEADIVWGVAGWQKNLSEVSEVLRLQNIPLNIIINGFNNETSAVAFTDHALSALVQVYNLPGVVYSSLTVQNWNPASPTPLFDLNGSATTPGTLANVARYVPSIEAAAGIYRNYGASVSASQNELYFATRNLSTGTMTVPALQESLSEIAPLRVALQNYASKNLNFPPITDMLQAFSPSVSDSSAMSKASSFVPAGMSLSKTNYLALPKVISEVYYLKNILDPGAIGNIYIPASNAMNIMLPDGLSATITFVGTVTNKAPALIQGGASKAYVYLANGAVRYEIGSPLETIIDATGSSNSTIVSSSAHASATVRGANGTIARLMVTDVGFVALSSATEYTQVNLIVGSTINLSDAKNITLAFSQKPRIPGSIAANVINSTSMLRATHVTNSSQSVVNAGAAPLLLSASAAGAGARLDGRTAGIIVDITSGGTIRELSSSRNVTFRALVKGSYFLNSDPRSKIELLDGASGSDVVLKARGQRVTVDATLLASSTKIDGGNVGTLVLTGGGKVFLTQNVVRMGEIRLDNTPNLAAIELNLSSFQSTTPLYVDRGDAILSVNSKSQTVTNSGKGLVSIFVSPENARVGVFAGAGRAKMNFTSGGTFATNAFGTVDMYLAHPSNLYVNANPKISVHVTANNPGLNSVGIAAAGQGVYVENGRYSCVYVDANNIGVGTGTTIQAGGLGQVNIYGGGSVTLREEITGVKQIFLYNSTNAKAYSLSISDYQAATTIYDVAGGSKIYVTSPSQSVVNIGALPTLVVASGEDAGIRINGGSAGATLEIVDGGSAVLSRDLFNVLVRLTKPIFMTTSSGAANTVDATIGGSTIDVRSTTQKIMTGAGTTVVDNVNAKISVEGTLDQFANNTFLNFGNDDVMLVRDLIPGQIVLSATGSGYGTTLNVSNGSVKASLYFDATLKSENFSLSWDGQNGTIVKLVH